MGAEKYARQTKLYIPGTFEYDLETASEYREGYLNTYLGIKERSYYLRSAWKKGVREFKTISGRKRHFRDEYVAAGKILNAEIQGSSADLLKVCFYIIDKYVLPRYPGTRFMLQIHDEIVLICPKRFSKEVSILVKYVLEYPWFNISVPLLASAKICNKWSDNSNDKIPEVGYLFVEVNGEKRIFDSSNWGEWVKIQENKQNKITTKSACAHLSEDQKGFCKTIIPDKGPLIRTGFIKRVVTRNEELQKRLELKE